MVFVVQKKYTNEKLIETGMGWDGVRWNGMRKTKQWAMIQSNENEYTHFKRDYLRNCFVTHIFGFETSLSLSINMLA